MQNLDRITPCLRFDGKAEEAAWFYRLQMTKLDIEEVKRGYKE